MANYLNINHIPKKTLIFGENVQSINDYLNFFLAKINCANFNNLNHNDKKCLFCQKIINHQLLNIKYLGDFNKDITKEELLNFIADSNYFHFQDKVQIYVINGLEKLNENNQNSILKWVEDLSLNTYIICLSLNLNQIVKTLKSRLVLFNVPLLNYDLNVDDEIKELSTIFIKSLNFKKRNQLFLISDRLLNLNQLFDFFLFTFFALNKNEKLLQIASYLLVEAEILKFINNFSKFKNFKKIYLFKFLNNVYQLF